MTQIILDNSLSTNTKIENQPNLQTISEGKTSGKNLFLSFESFSLSAGEKVHITNNSTIENIFIRVTGTSISNLDGLIKVEGAANLFLLNANGIVFDENVSLDIGGSFIGSTANSINFGNDNSFEVNLSQAKPVFASSIPIGLEFLNSPGIIQVTGTSSQVTKQSNLDPFTVNDNSSVRIKPGKTLALIGAGVNIEGGILKTVEGKIEIGSISNGLVNLQANQNGWSFGYQQTSNFENIQLSKKSLLYANNTDNSSISICGANVELTDSSLMLIQNNSSGSVGNININASESFIARGIAVDRKSYGGLRSENLGTGKGADIKVECKNLVLHEGAIVSDTFGDGEGGNISIESLNSIDLSATATVIGSFTRDAGGAGDVRVSTEILELKNGGQVASYTSGAGSGGSVEVNASEIELIGISGTGKSPSLLGTTAFNRGFSGNVSVKTSKLKLMDGGFVSTNSLADGNAGSVAIEATDSIQISGKRDALVSTIGSSVIVLYDRNFRENNHLPELPKGNSGVIEIDTPLLSIIEGGAIAVSNEGTGDAGNLIIKAESVNLDDRSSISADAVQGKAGTIQIEAKNLSPSAAERITAKSESSIDGLITY
ncbi:MAG: hypothetical protein RLZZ381_1232 [Cyanobacteriota bacterium]|jgi:filamentous hemagglutinin family protein